MKLLNSLILPDDLKKLNLEDKNNLCSEIREEIITVVSKNGGHLASNLGTVELTVAIHSVFDSPKDKIIFDVGHQAYTHKLLTGRADRFHTLRQKGGISGFMRPDESEHDPVITGHSSASISNALGIAEGMKIKGEDGFAVAVIGDGALTGGLAYEGLNNAGRSNAKLIVVLNHNSMSISKNIGGISKYLSDIRINRSYIKTKNATKNFLSHIWLIGKPLSQAISKLKNKLKSKLLVNTIFEDLGFDYLGPVDGHDIAEIEAALEVAKTVQGPVVVQVNTVKGKGYAPAENYPGEFHGVSGYNIETGEKPASKESFAEIFGKELVEIAKTNDKVCAITAAMKYGVGLNEFSKAFPERFFDVGIAEEHAVSFASGLSKTGMIPVVAIYSTFLQRSYDQLIHDIAISGSKCVICVGNAGIAGEDGETHQGLFDISFLTSIPNVTIYSPSSYNELKSCLNKAINQDDGLVCVRYPRGCETASLNNDSDFIYTNRNSDKLIIAYGKEASIASASAEKLCCSFLHLTKIFPIDDSIYEIINCYSKAYMFEEAVFEGSIGQKLMAKCNNLKSYAISGFVPHMKPCEALDLYNLSEEKIIETVKENL